jgi:hypothetical protein
MVGGGSDAAESSSTTSNTFGGITQHFTFTGGTDANTAAQLRQAALDGAHGGYQLMIKDLKSNGPARQLLARR